MSLAEIIEDYSELTEEYIKAALAYTADKEHKIKIASWNSYCLPKILLDLIHKIYH